MSSFPSIYIIIAAFPRGQNSGGACEPSGDQPGLKMALTIIADSGSYIQHSRYCVAGYWCDPPDFVNSTTMSYNATTTCPPNLPNCNGVTHEG